MDFNFRQYDPQIGRFMGVDPLAANGGQDMISPYAAMGNAPESLTDPTGLRVGPPLKITMPGVGYGLIDNSMSEGYANMLRINADLVRMGMDPIGDFGSGGGGGGGSGSWSGFMSMQQTVMQIASDMAFWGTVLGSRSGDTYNGQGRYLGNFQPKVNSQGAGGNMDRLIAYNGDNIWQFMGGSGDGDNPQSSANSPTGQATVYVETDGIGHAYIEVDGTVFSYGRYNGSYSPSSGRFGPYGDGVLLKMDGTDAAGFIKERNEMYPTNSYQVDVNTSNVYSYLNSLYSNGKSVVDKNGNVGPGRVIDTYTLIGPGGNNCTTLVSRALQQGGFPIGIYQTPASLNLFFFNSNAIHQGYNPGLWGPKQ